MTEINFNVVGVEYAGGFEALLMWTEASGGFNSIQDSWDERVVLNPVPVREIGIPILDYDKKLLYPAGTSLSEIQIDETENYYFGEKLTYGLLLLQKLEDFQKAIQVIVHIEGERFTVGWVPANISKRIYDELEYWYVRQARCCDTKLEIWVAKRKDAPS